MGDWRRSLRNKSGSVQIGIVREKREQNVTVKLLARRETGAIIDHDDFVWDNSVDMEDHRRAENGDAAGSERLEEGF